MKARIRVDGTSAKLRLKSDQKLEFIVQLAIGVDPTKFKLFPLKLNGGRRETVVASATAFGGVKGQENTVPFDVTRYGQNSYKLTLSKPLEAGEYAFFANESNEAFCFGVDIPKNN